MKRKRLSIKEYLSPVYPTPPEHEVEAAGRRVWLRLQEEIKKYDTSLWSLYGDGWSAPATTQLEFQVLTAASTLSDRTDLNSITDMVETWTGGDMIVSVHSAVEDLVQRGLLKTRRLISAGGNDQARKCFDLTEDGGRALRRAAAEGKQLVPARGHLVRGEAR